MAISSRATKKLLQVKAIYNEMLGRAYTSKDGTTEDAAALKSFSYLLFFYVQRTGPRIEVCSAERSPSVASISSKGRKQRFVFLQCAPATGEYGSRGLRFILDRSRVNVAISRAKCIAVVVGDPSHCPGETPL